MIHPELCAGSPHRASACDGKKVANVIPVDHGAIRHREVRLPKPVSNTSNSISYVGSTGGRHSPCREARPNSERRTPIAAGVSRPAGSISHHRCARFRTQRLTPADPSRGSRGASPNDQRRSLKGEVMGKLEGKVAVITGGSSGLG